MLKNLFRKPTQEDAFATTYRRLQEKRIECEQQRQEIAVLDQEIEQLREQVAHREVDHLRAELEQAAEEITYLKNELHAREVVNQTIPYCVTPTFMVSNHTKLSLVVQTTKDGFSQVHAVAPYTQQAFSPADHVEFSIAEYTEEVVSEPTPPVKSTRGRPRKKVVSE